MNDSHDTRNPTEKHQQQLWAAVRFLERGGDITPHGSRFLNRIADTWSETDD